MEIDFIFKLSLLEMASQEGIVEISKNKNSGFRNLLALSTFLSYAVAVLLILFILFRCFQSRNAIIPPSSRNIIVDEEEERDDNGPAVVLQDL